MEYICIAVILGIFGGIYNSPIFFIIVILTGISIYILLAIFKKKIFNYNLDLKIQNKEKQINDIYEIDKKSKNGEYIVSIIDKKKGKNKSTYTVIFKDINRIKNIRINGKIHVKKDLELGKDYIVKGKLEKYNNERNYMGFNQRLYMYSRSNYFKIIEHNEKIEEYKKGMKNFFDIYNDIYLNIGLNIEKY